MKGPRALRGSIAGAFLLASLPLRADSIPGLVRAVVSLPADPEFEQTTELRCQELVGLSLPADARFLDGVQIELVLSAEARARFGDFGLVVYDRLAAPPIAGARPATGRKAFLRGLLAMNRLFYVASLTERPIQEEDLTQGIFALGEPRKPADYPILVGIVSLAKVVPEALQSLVFYVRCRPLVREAGAVTIRVNPPAGSVRHQFAVLVDDAPLDAAPSSAAPGGAWEASMELPAGIHSLRVSSPTLQQAQTTFSVDPGGTSIVEVQLKETSTSVTIEAPRGTAIYLDGQKVDYPRESRIGLTSGEHTVRFRLGDFSGTRTFTAAEGKSYTVYLELDVSVKEN